MTTMTIEAKEAVADTMTMTIRREVIEEMTSTKSPQAVVTLENTQRRSIKSKVKAMINPNLPRVKVSDITRTLSSVNQMLIENLLSLANKRETTVAVMIVPSQEM